VRNGNLFGRGTLTKRPGPYPPEALESLQRVDGKLSINVKVLIEGKKKSGAFSLWNYVSEEQGKAKGRRACRLRYFMLGKGVPSITYGLRGLNYYQIELTARSAICTPAYIGGAVPIRSPI